MYIKVMLDKSNVKYVLVPLNMVSLQVYNGSYLLRCDGESYGLSVEEGARIEGLLTGKGQIELLEE